VKVRIVDYVANLGGGVRFSVETLRALADHRGVSFEVVGHGDALRRYRELLAGVVPATFVDIPPRQAWRGRTLLAGIPGAGPLNWLLRTNSFRILVPPAALEDCDLAWFPWIHRHQIPWSMAGRVVGSLHDLIAVDFPDWFPGWGLVERETLEAWLASEARVAVSSHATDASLARLFGTRTGRVSVIPLSGQHVLPPERAETRGWPFQGRHYLLCPANLSPHKNHAVLAAGIAGMAGRHPLVLTGDGTDLYESAAPRAQEVRQLMEQQGMVRGESLFGVGYVDDGQYYRILEGAWAVVMPTLAEGGGSFPVWEAMERGIPAVVSDIPVMREMVDRAGGEVLWFDPKFPDSLSRALAELEANYERHCSRARALTHVLRSRTWRDVAADYARLMGLPADKMGRDS